MVSPAGVRVPPEGETWQLRLSRRYGSGNGPPRWVQPAAKLVWGSKLTPFDGMRFLGQRQTLKLLNGYISNRFGISGEEEKQALIKYFYQVSMRQGTTEYAIHGLFTPALQAHLPLGSSERLGSRDSPVPVSFFYGDDDWMLKAEEDAAQICVFKHKTKFGNRSNFYLIPRAGHNLHIDNPGSLADHLIQDVFAEGEDF